MNATEIKKHLNKPVIFRNKKAGIDSVYMFTGAIFRKGSDGYFYQAELQEMNGRRTIVICSLEDIYPTE